MTTSSLFARLKEATADEWSAYTDHEFIRTMEDGSLPREAFRQYLIQDYHFLIQFARGYALSVFKARTLDDMKTAQQGLANILHETDQHLDRLAAGWDMDREAIHQVKEHPANIAYTRYVLDAGMSGDLLDLNVALAPCVVGYAEIGLRLAPAITDHPEHPYAEWIGEYGSQWYQQAAADAVTQLDSLAARSFTEERFTELTQIFSTATRLEAAFWQMGLDLAADKARARA